MKKGFTLIELLAVILILGIIALIAIPTVNKILDEAREGAFRTSSDNVMKAIEAKCQTSIIKGEIPNKTYVFTNGEINSSIEIKGTLPNNGYIILDSECAIEEFYLTQNKYVYSNVSEENYKTNYMLKAPINSEESIFKTLYSSYYNDLLSINFVNHLNIPENAIEIKDPSVSQKGKIKSWLVPNDTKYDLFIGSLNKIYANYDSTRLIANSSATILNLDNLFTDFTQNFLGFFEKTQFTSLDLTKLNTSNAINFTAVFSESKKLINLNLSNWNIDNVETFHQLFYGCHELKTINITNWDTKNVKSFGLMFNDCNNLENIIGIENLNTSNVETVSHLFDSCRELKYIDLSKWNTIKFNDINNLFSDDNNVSMNLLEINLSNWDIKNATYANNVFLNNTTTNKIIMKNSNYQSVNKIIDNLNNRTSTTAGTLDITGVDDISKVNISTAQSKNWVVIS